MCVQRLASGFLGKLIKLDLVADLPMDARNKCVQSAAPSRHHGITASERPVTRCVHAAWMHVDCMCSGMEEASARVHGALC